MSRICSGSANALRHRFRPRYFNRLGVLLGALRSDFESPAFSFVSENKKAPEPRGSGAKLGGRRSPRALSRSHTVGRLAFAGRVLPDATLRGMRSSRSHGGIAAVVSGCGLSSEVSSPGSAATCRWRTRRTGCRHASKYVIRVGTFVARTAPAFGRALAPRYGSDLLTLRSLWACSRVMRFFAPPC